MKIIALVVAILAAIGAWYFISQVLLVEDSGDTVEPSEIRSFTDCEKAGYPVMESYPRRCSVPDGRTYTEEIVVNAEYDNAGPDMIQVELPYPGAVVGKEFRVIGKARGNWFFEASFPIEVTTPEGATIAGSFATAEGDWMTTDFVEFKSEIIDLPSAYIGPAVLILRKDNPSGLPEHDASVYFPIVVEY